jgi:hypothetical protein
LGGEQAARWRRLLQVEQILAMHQAREHHRDARHKEGKSFHGTSGNLVAGMRLGKKKPDL